MRFSLHTFEIECQLSKSSFNELKDRFFTRFGRDRHGWMPMLYANKKLIICNSLRAKGINHVILTDIELEGIACRYSVNLVVNPRRLFGKTMNPFTGIATEEHLENTPEILDAIIQEICPDFPSIFRFGKIVRIDYCTNIDMETKKKAKAYLNILRKGYWIGTLKPQKVYDIKKKRKVFKAGRMKVKNKSYEIEIYLKQIEMFQRLDIYEGYEIEEAEGVVRFEFRVGRRKLDGLREKYGIRSETDLLWSTSQIAETEFVRFFSRIYGTGDFISQKEAAERIGSSAFNQNVKDKMNLIVVEVKYNQDMKEAFGQLGFSKAAISNYMKYFNELGISPITYGKNGTIYYNPLRYIDTANVNDGRKI